MRNPRCMAPPAGQMPEQQPVAPSGTQGVFPPLTTQMQQRLQTCSHSAWSSLSYCHFGHFGMHGESVARDLKGQHRAWRVQGPPSM